MYSFNNKYNVYKNKTSIPDRNMRLHAHGSARGSELFPGVRTSSSRRDAGIKAALWSSPGSRFCS